MYHHRKQAAYLAQLSTQGEPMKQVSLHTHKHTPAPTKQSKCCYDVILYVIALRKISVTFLLHYLQLPTHTNTVFTLIVFNSIINMTNCFKERNN